MKSIYEISIGDNNKCIFLSAERVIIRSTDDNKVKLTTTEAKMLKLLCSHVGKNVKRAYIEDEVWRGRGVIPTAASLNQLVCTLRQKIKHVAEMNIIVTVPRVGFILSDIVNVYPKIDRSNHLTHHKN
ncbi:hypothetical protein C9J03_25305 [Photobacterium gaetbulicola]|uniref:Putative transcriptional regulatory protein, C terminal n=1 Tax=Photobacterium gaetbulicola Gung47 TaxID=658445 RepID=A0A0C4JMZ3_9GAMM|nr:helix-turn-helix domain-containing protein [Photobacterium gaetbulicola]AHA59181.1 putative transcriptional regulatory protein, C terminal [Photobacterium gaetbulicola Gung47]PSU00007.1 hypothetical protein C9J03_25305 [Photobacterium gaetbulicola]